MEMIQEKAYAKVNLGLDILSKRPDGYHEVSMVMHSIDLCDEINISKREDGKRTYVTDSHKLPMDNTNLVCKAADLFCETYGIEAGFSIELIKRIPMAAGLAGGSSDAAAVLRGLNLLFDVNASEEELMRLGKKLGADVPYCVMGKTALAEGIGEILTPIASPDYKYWLVVKPVVDVSTKWAYDEIDNATDLSHPDIKGLVSALKAGQDNKAFSRMENIFETVMREKYPIISQIRQAMESEGALKAMMSGSGPTVFGIFDTEEALNKAAEKINCLEHEFIYKIR